MVSCSRRTNTSLSSHSATYTFVEPSDRRSTASSIHICFATPISGSLRAQSIVALSTGEAEHYAVNQATKEIVWLRRILDHFDKHLKSPSTVHITNNCAIKIAGNCGNNKMRKYLDIRRHYIQAHIGKGNISLKDILSRDNYTKKLTK